MLVGRPVPRSATTNVPIAQRIHQRIESLASTVAIVVIHSIDGLFASCRQLAHHPTIQFATFDDGAIGWRLCKLFRGQLRKRPNDIGRPLETIDFRIDGKEAKDVPESKNELGNTISNGSFTVENGIPRWLVCE